MIQKRLRNTQANALLGGEFTEGATIVVNQQNGERGLTQNCNAARCFRYFNDL